ncbi:MAG TPA: ADP-ribosylation factor-like protein [Candidatus Lokiarchaeia archaeon]|nr:ADP-ribosylation factor-like protein [Candidatus Lokiarchaeia archaeon]
MSATPSEFSLLLSYFDVLRGPRVFHIEPAEQDLTNAEEIASLLSFPEKDKFFLHAFNNYQVANYMFEIPAPEARGRGVELQLSLAVKQEFFDSRAPALYQQLSNAREFLEQIADAIKDIPQISRAFLPTKVESKALRKFQEKAKNSIAAYLAEGVTNFRQVQAPVDEEPISKIFIFGETGAGKKSILQLLQESVYKQTNPKLPELLYSISVGETSVVTYDCLVPPAEGSCMTCSLLDKCISGIHGLIAVFTGSSLDELNTSKDHFWQVLANPLIKGVPLLVLLHKSDLPPVMTHDELIAFLELSNLEGMPWKTFDTTTEDPGTLVHAFRWLIRHIV